MIPVVVSNADDGQVRTAIDVAEAIRGILDRHQEYVEGKRLPLLPAERRIRQDLTSLLQDSALGYDKSVASAAGLIVGAMSERQDMERLPYLGQALVLVAESERGKTNEVMFHDVMSYLLATNGYTPVRMQEYYGGAVYTFYAGITGEKIVAVGEKSCRVNCVTLKDEFRLDELVDDFMNLKKGTKREVESYVVYEPLNKFLGVVFGVPVGTMVSIPLISYNPLFMLLGVALGGVGGYYGTKQWMNFRYNQKLEKAKPTFPYTSLTNGVYALLDAFVIEGNGVVEGKKIE